MQVVRAGSGTLRSAPVEGGPRAEVLVRGDGGELGVVRVEVAPGGGMGEHDHGASEALVAVVSGRVEVRDDEGPVTLDAGTVAVMSVGERVSLRNPSDSEPAELLAVFSPPGFVEHLESWPVVDRSAGRA
ncbi:cupin domain-containing protein [Rubrobacter radiotolerans]|uniref:Cupin domain-containing protein n=2 Tax=Rubrobacter radiotolerans TaxID=42256 RepID=A0AB35T6A6_RUBRA|nr:cupin domain-containing protein [Rubrobacter radiotolerans]MDX5893266.1 cupin domain-containing protein [Rubrobacter radiotolerans]